MDERRAGTQDQRDFIGVKADEAAIRWIWNNHFAAVAGDTYAFEG